MAIRWQVLRDLERAPAGAVAAERARVEREGWGARLLALRDPDGQWAGGACFPRYVAEDWRAGIVPDFSQGQPWTSTLPTLVLLADLGLDPACQSDVHVILDNLSAHKTAEIRQWLDDPRRQRWHLHFTPTSSSWTNLVERWFKELTDKRLRRGVFTSVADLTAAITTWADHWNADPKPFIWKAPAEDTIAKVTRGREALHRVKSQTHH